MDVLGAFACDGPERGFRGILFALERDYGLPDTCPSGSVIFWIILFVFRQSPMPTLSAPRRMKMRSRGMLLYTPARRGRVTLVPKSPTGSLT